MSIFFPFNSNPYAISTLFGRSIGYTLFTIFPCKSYAYKPPVATSLSVPIINDCDGFALLIQIAGSSVSCGVAWETTVGFSAFFATRANFEELQDVTKAVTAKRYSTFFIF